ncbi:MAG: hypothetical protein AAFZ15_33415 [Bacteroidota bacterium]
MEKNQVENRLPTLFISHRHQDRILADIFRTAFEEWSNGNVTVFQSSNERAGIGVGEELDDSINKAAADASVLLLIYTVTDDDWTWCMYECGLAQDPKTLDTRILVFHTAENPPSPLAHLLTLPMTLDSIKTLVNQFHHKEDFFIDRGKAIAPEVSQKIIDQRTLKLYNDLSAKITSDVIETTIRYDQISVSIAMEHVENIKSKYQETNFKNTLEYAVKILREKCMIYGFSGDPHTHFEMDKTPLDIELDQLIRDWRKGTEYPDLKWDEELFTEMTKAILNLKEGAISTPFNSLDPDSTVWFLPLIHTSRINPQNGHFEMDITFYKLKESTAKLLIDQA